MSYYSDIILEKYQVRRGKKKKIAFIDFVKDEASKCGYDVNVEKGSLGARNIVIGHPEKAKVVYTAHYDTCAWLPFPNFITPKNIGIYLLYQLVVTVAVFAIAFGAAVLIDKLIATEDKALSGLIFFWSFEIIVFGILGLIIAGPANKHTANDNTSGVMTLLTLMKKLPEEMREKCAFVFFDLEEMGMVGSAAFAKQHIDVSKNTLLLNFDCVSDGDNFILTLPKKAHDMENTLKSAFESDKFNVEILKKGYIYPSDQMRFKKGVGIAALKRFKDTKILYMDRIHTSRDTVYQEENIEFLSDAAVKLVENF